VIEGEIVIPAIGQVPSTEVVDFSGGPELTPWGTIKVDPVTQHTTVREILSAGDCVTGPSSVIAAIAGGQKAAIHIDRLLGGSGVLPGDTGFSFVKPDEETLAESPPRAVEKTIPIEKRKRSFAEVVLGLDREQAAREASRCLRCDLERE
jgi:NADPH-dependent glutamate synthase beta subunit-like oxidoreductase